MLGEFRRQIFPNKWHLQRDTVIESQELADANCDMDEEKTLATKLTQLQLSTDKTTAVLQQGIPGRIERHKEAINDLIKTAEEAKRVLEEKKIREMDADGDLTEIQRWSEEIENKISESDVEVTRLQDWLDGRKNAAMAKQRKEELEFQKELNETKVQIRSSKKPQI